MFIAHYSLRTLRRSDGRNGSSLIYAKLSSAHPNGVGAGLGVHSYKHLTPSG